MSRRPTRSVNRMLLAGCIAGCILVSSTVRARAGRGKQRPEQSPAAASSAPRPTSPSPAPPTLDWHAIHGTFYRRHWGVDIFGVRLVSSGSMLEFR